MENSNLKIYDYYSSDNKEHWLKEIEKCDWRAGKYLYELLRDRKLKELCGESTRVLLLTEGDELLAFCTYAEQDDIRDASLTPWVGFAYTFPDLARLRSWQRHHQEDVCPGERSAAKRPYRLCLLLRHGQSR